MQGILKRSIFWALLAVGLSGAARGDQTTLVAVSDATIYSESPDIANGSGEQFFCGRVNGDPIRRGLLAFDLSTIPAGSTINSVTLTLYMNRSKQGTDNTYLHLVTTPWNEGPSNPEAEEGGGVAALEGDSTWLYTYYNLANPSASPAWSVPGGDFAAIPSAVTPVGSDGQYYSWTSLMMASDVQLWLDIPSMNHGWVLIGNESTPRTATRFASRSNPEINQRPRLIVNFTPPASTGACNLPNGSCVVDTQGNCLAAGGTYLGDGTSCPDPTGACCLPSGACVTDTEANCIAQGGVFQGDNSDCVDVTCPVILEPFVDALVIPPVATPTTGTVGGVATYDISMVQTTQNVHRDLPPTTLWTYNGTWPGPTILARRDMPVTVNWINDLRDEQGNPRSDHYFPVDPCPHGAQDLPKTVVHLHGGHVPAEFDGYPEDTFLPGQSATYIYPNNQRAGLSWYHDHALGITRLNVMMGLAAGYIIRDSEEDALGLPAGEFEVPLVIQDRSFNADGSLKYPESWGQQFFGDYNVVNGIVTPYLDVKQATYRFRIISGANSRAYTLSFSDGRAFQLIGVDGGLLTAPQTLTEITLAGAERADILVHFTAADQGQSIELVNSAPAPFPGTPGAGVLPEVMQFRVTNQSGPTYSPPGTLSVIDPLSEIDAARAREFVLDRYSDPCAGSVWKINGLHWDDVTETPYLNTTEIWEFVNVSGGVHPMHMHLVFFQVLDRTPIEVVNGSIVETGPAVGPDPNELGWKDTVKVLPLEKVRVIARFEDYTGLYSYHCHILEHEDHEMMRQFEVVRCPADTNNDGILSPADFTAWIAAFNAMAPECDQNDDGLCTPADFTAWIANYNAGC